MFYFNFDLSLKNITILCALLFSTSAQASQTSTYCVSDYFKYCSQYSIGSNELGQCMAKVGVKLSKQCIRAMVADKYITKQQVIDRAAQQGYVVADTANGLDIVGKVQSKPITTTPPVKVTVANAPKKSLLYKKKLKVCTTDQMNQSYTGQTFYDCK